MPATLPGLVLRMKVGEGRHALAVEHARSRPRRSARPAAAWSGRRPRRRRGRGSDRGRRPAAAAACTSSACRYAASGIAPSPCRLCSRPCDVGARALRDQLGVVERRAVPGEIGVQVGDRLVERDRKAGLVVEPRRRRRCRPRPAPRRRPSGAPARRPSAAPSSASSGSQKCARGTPRRRPFRLGAARGGAAGDDAVEQHAVGDAARHRPGGVAGVRDRHDAGLRPAAGRRPEADDAAQRRRDAHRAAGVGADAAGRDARADRDADAAARAARECACGRKDCAPRRTRRCCW